MPMARNDKNNIYGYGVRLTRIVEGDGGGWLAEVPDLPGCMSDGDTPEDALVDDEFAQSGCRCSRRRCR